MFLELLIHSQTHCQHKEQTYRAAFAVAVFSGQYSPHYHAEQSLGESSHEK